MTKMINLSPGQLEASQKIKDWYYGNEQEFYLAGYAGTGKSTIVNQLIANFNIDHVVYCAFTGKAASVLASKGNTPASTVHSLIYYPAVDPKTKKVTFQLKDELEIPVDLIVLDECSMISESLYEDLLSFDKRILILGDPGQLPPVDGKSPFGVPDHTLTEIHRQAEDSIILKAATKARKGEGVLKEESEDYKVIQSNPFDKSLKKEEILKTLIKDKPFNDCQVICGLNRTRNKINSLYRKVAGFHNRLPMAGEKIICLKNSREFGLFNGQMLTMVDHSLMTPTYDKLQESKIYSVDCTVQDDDGHVRNIPIDMRFFTNEKLLPQQDAIANPFTFAYAITCHKSQGSQWDEVIVINESGYFKDLSDKWLYTAITRGAKKVWIIE